MGRFGRLGTSKSVWVTRQKTSTEVDRASWQPLLHRLPSCPGASAVSPRLEPKLKWTIYGFLIDPRSTPTDTSTTGPRARGSSTILPLASPPPLGFSIAGAVDAYLAMMLFMQPSKTGY